MTPCQPASPNETAQRGDVNLFILSARLLLTANLDFDRSQHAIMEPRDLALTNDGLEDAKMREGIFIKEAALAACSSSFSLSFVACDFQPFDVSWLAF
jgi:hypothetical protein